MSSRSTRRTFLKSTALAAIGMPTYIPASALGKNGKVAPSNRIVLGGIGVGQYSFFLQKDQDPQKERREIIKRKTDEHYGNKDCVVYDDMSGILERNDIDAVLITTGDRWHATASIYAARAGKDIQTTISRNTRESSRRELSVVVFQTLNWRPIWH